LVLEVSQVKPVDRHQQHEIIKMDGKQSLRIHLAQIRQAIRTFHMDNSKASTPLLAFPRCEHHKWHHHDQPSLSLIPSALLTLVLLTRPQAPLQLATTPRLAPGSGMRREIGGEDSLLAPVPRAAGSTV
jgi:hypothetical protein